jgi:hypothetical protein
MKSITSHICTAAASFLICGYSFSASADGRGNEHRDLRGHENNREYSNDQRSDRNYHDGKDNRDTDNRRDDWRDRDDNGNHEREHGRVVRNAFFIVPRGYLPHPGECRIWYPDRPVHKQPQGFYKHRQFRDEPRDAYVVRCEPDVQNRVRVHLSLNGVEVAVQWYDSQGAFLFENRR